MTLNHGFSRVSSGGLMQMGKLTLRCVGVAWGGVALQPSVSNYAQCQYLGMGAVLLPDVTFRRKFSEKLQRNPDNKVVFFPLKYEKL